MIWAIQVIDTLIIFVPAATFFQLHFLLLFLITIIVKVACCKSSWFLKGLFQFRWHIYLDVWCLNDSLNSCITSFCLDGSATLCALQTITRMLPSEFNAP